MSCCPENSLGFLQEDPNYVLKGKVIEIPASNKQSKIDAYIVGEGSKGLVVNCDMFGIHSGLHKRVCDEISALLLGCSSLSYLIYSHMLIFISLIDVVVILPDYFMNGTIVYGDNTSWFFFPRLIGAFFSGGFSQYPWETSMKVTFDTTVDYLIQTHKVSKVALWGFCWGGYVNFRASGESLHVNIIAGAVSSHPSVSGVGMIFSDNIEEIVKKVRCPQFVMSSNQEPADWKPGGKVEEWLKAKTFSVPSKVIHYNQTHGFVTRGDLKKENEARDMRDAILQTADYVKSVLG
jgi:dienelactone hydrolase